MTMRSRWAVLVLATACAHANAAPATPRTAASDDSGDDNADDPEDGSDVLPAPGAPAASTTAPSSHASTSLRAALLAEAQRELAAVRETRYTHRTHIDEATGAFDYDCSGFVGYALATATPAAWKPIAAIARRPVARDFEQFFAAPNGPIGPWTAVKHANDLAPGDVIAWLEPPEKHSHNTGHVMIVAAPPHRRDGYPNELVVSVIDSSHSGHGKADARVRDHASGLGTGELVLIADEDGRAIGYRWSTARASVAYRTAIALGHLP